MFGNLWRGKLKPSTAKTKGAATEIAAVKEFQEVYNLKNVERRHLSGSCDKGDIAGWARLDKSRSVCVEIKSGATLAIPKWLAELKAEKCNAQADLGFVMVRPKGKPAVKDWFIVMPFPEFMELTREAGYLHD